MMMKRKTVRFHPATPILSVRDLARSVRYYVDRLGFKVDWQQPHVFASVSRGRCTIFLAEGDQGHAGGWTYVGVGDSGALYLELRGRGAKVRQPPTNFPWAREIQVEDPDGNVLRFGSDSRKDEKYGPWLDMRGDRWLAEPGGGWRRVKGRRSR